MREAKILIVEDEMIVAKELENSLEANGYKVPAIVDTGEKAVKKAKQTNPDLIIMDIKLKGKQDGIEAAKQIHSHYNTPIIFLTAHKSEDILEKAKIVEPYAFIVKPFVTSEMLINIKMALYKHKMETKLQRIKYELQLILDSIPTMICYIDRNDRIMRANKSFADKLGFDVKKIIGKTIHKILPDESYKMKKFNREVIESGNPKMNIIERYNMKKSTKWFLSNKVPFKNRTGEIIGLIYIAHDITKLKDMEEELRRKEKLKSLGVLAAGIAHEFNNLLTGILGNISYAKVYAEKTDNELLHILSKSEEASLKAKNLTQRLLTFSKGGLPVTTITSLRKLIIDAAKIAFKDSDINIKFQLDNDLWKVKIDKLQIHQVINNILTNAYEAMENTKKIIISGKNTIIDDTETSTIHSGKYVKITITDTGAGIPKEIKKNIFDPFFSTKDGHCGLGLSASHSIIKNHKGYIDIDSKVERGTSVIIYLPKAQGKSEMKKEKKKKPISNVKGNILFMDDEEIVRDVAGRMLGALGYKVKFVKNGEEAIETYKKLSKSNNYFDFVILDLTVPGGMGGKECISKLKKINRNIKAIVSSGYSNNDVITDYNKYGFSGAVTKPYNLDELRRVIESL